MTKADAKRIKRLQAMCDQLDALRRQAEGICKLATIEIGESRRRNQTERRLKRRKPKRERRR